MPRKKASLEERRRSWAAISRAAMEYHDHHEDRGLGVLIAKDAGVKPQSVSDWKRLATSADEKQIMKLAEKYGVSAEELAGFIPPAEAISQKYKRHDDFSSAVLRLAGEVSALILPEGEYSQYQALHEKAHALLLDEQDEDTAFRALCLYAQELKRKD